MPLCAMDGDFASNNKIILHDVLQIVVNCVREEMYLHVNVSGLNKFKKRRFHETVNLLTGETDAHPDLIKVIT